MLSDPSIAVLNHLLAQNSWASRRLAHFAGKTVRFDIAPFTLSCTIGADGMLLASAAGASTDARCMIAPSLLPRLALHDEQAYSQIEGEGDLALLAEIQSLARNLRWDAAEDLSKVTGDIAAERIVRTVKDTGRLASNAAVNLAQAATEYWTEENPLLATTEQVRTFAHQVDVLREEITRLEQRVSKLSGPD